MSKWFGLVVCYKMNRESPVHFAKLHKNKIELEAIIDGPLLKKSVPPFFWFVHISSYRVPFRPWLMLLVTISHGKSIIFTIHARWRLCIMHFTIYELLHTNVCG